jgi:starvation-inducible DNA-binding protein
MSKSVQFVERKCQSVITDLSTDATRDISAGLKGLLADVFALYLKTKNFHWHMSGSHFRDYHLLLDEQGDQIFAMTDPIAERARKIGGATLHSIGEISRMQRLLSTSVRDFIATSSSNASLPITMRMMCV